MGSWCITVCGCGGRGQERGIYVYLWLSHIAVQQKQTQHCKTTIVVGYVRTQSCLNICNPMDCSLPGASVHGIFQARILEWVAISYPRGSSWSRDWTQVSYISCIARQILYHCTTWKILKKKKKKKSPSSSAWTSIKYECSLIFQSYLPLVLLTVSLIQDAFLLTIPRRCHLHFYVFTPLVILFPSKVFTIL